MADLLYAFQKRNEYYEDTIKNTIESMSKEIEEAIGLLVDSITTGYSVRFLGAGRARLAATMPANRLCHAGAQVSIMSDTIPLPNTRLGGYVFAVSASGTSVDVIQAMIKARKRRFGGEERGRKIAPITIPIVGISALTGITHDKGDKEKTQKNTDLCNSFKEACDIFIHIQVNDAMKSEYNYLADNEEHVIMELLDLMVACAIKRAGIKILHEDLGPTGAVFAESEVER